MKTIQLLSILTMSILLNACNSESSSFKAYTQQAQAKVQLYQGYLEDSQGNAFEASVFFQQDKLTLMKLTDVEDKATFISSSNTPNYFQLDDFKCELSNENLTCNTFELLPVQTFVVDVKDLNGAYKTNDQLNETWEMSIHNGEVLIQNETTNCQLAGKVTIVDLLYFEFDSNTCQEHEMLQGYAKLHQLYIENDTIELMLPDFLEISTYWTKV